MDEYDVPFLHDTDFFEFFLDLFVNKSEDVYTYNMFITRISNDYVRTLANTEHPQ